VDNIAHRIGSHTLIVYDINTSSAEADENESLAILRPLFRRFNCRVIFVKPGCAIVVFEDQISWKDCWESIGGGIRNKFRLRCPE
jgi:hypothetical protein